MTVRLWEMPTRSLVEQVQSQLDVAVAVYKADPDLLQEHANLEDSFRTGGYARRQVLELVQNASDALLQSERPGRVDVVLTDDALYCANEGAPFTAQGVRTVTHAYLSEKRGEEIGRFGLGFKSILAVSTHAQVFSRSVSFEFNSQTAQDALSRATDSTTRLPLLRVPTIFDHEQEFQRDSQLADLARWASTIVKMPLDGATSNLATQLAEFPSEFLLFANYVNELNIIDRRTGQSERIHRHACVALGNNNFDFRRPGGEIETWVVVEHMHRPSLSAKNSVGLAIVRDEIKIAYAAPLTGSTQQIGHFWAYYPLDEATTAAGIFNAPWAVNEDRTKMVQSIYNDEILDAFADIFIDTMPRFRTKADPARHFDYLPARGREPRGHGDKVLSDLIPLRAAKQGIIPSGEGTLCSGSQLRNLHFVSRNVWQGKADAREWHKRWQSAAHTGNDVPHFACYGTNRRYARLREQFLEEQRLVGAEERLLEASLNNEPISAWLTELAQSKTVYDCTAALGLFRALTDVDARHEALTAEVIPTSHGLAPLSAAKSAFLPSDYDDELSEFRVIDREFAEAHNNTRWLAELGFHPLDAKSLARALFNRLGVRSSDSEWDRAWGALDDLSTQQALKLLEERTALGSITKVMTKAGSWEPAEKTFVEEQLKITIADKQKVVDTKFCGAQLAATAGAIAAVDPNFPVVGETLFGAYKEWAAGKYRAAHPDRPASETSAASFDIRHAPGPLDVYLYTDAEQSEPSKIHWTSQLLMASRGTVAPWELSFSNDHAPVLVAPPHLWAIMEYGALTTTWGVRRPNDAIAASMLQWAAFLPAATDASTRPLKLPDSLETIPHHIWEEFISRNVQNIASDVETRERFSALVYNALVKLRSNEKWTALIPAIVNDGVEQFPAHSVYVSCDQAEIEYLVKGRHPHLIVRTEDEKQGFLQIADCKDASDAISIGLETTEIGLPDAIEDLFPGLARYFVRSLLSTQLRRCASLSRRVITPSGATDVPIKSAMHNGELLVPTTLSDLETLRAISSELGQPLTANDIEAILQQRDDAVVEELKLKCRACSTDEERLNMLVGVPALRAKLPTGLLSVLEALGEEITDTMIPSVFLSVYGNDSLRQLRNDLDERNLQIPRDWAGSSRAQHFVTDLGFTLAFAGQRSSDPEPVSVVLGKPGLHPLHDYQESASELIRKLLRSPQGAAAKALVELPTGAGKTRVAVESVVRSFLEGDLSGPVLWIAQSDELCSQAVETWDEVWREFSDNRALTIGRLWSRNFIPEPETELSVIVATDAKLRTTVINDTAYAWLANASAVVVDEAHQADTSTYNGILRWLGVDSRKKERPLLGLSATPFKGRNAAGTDTLARRFGRNLIQPLGEDPISELQRRGVLSKVVRRKLQGASVHLSEEEREAAATQRRFMPSVLERIGSDEARTKRLVDDICSLDDKQSVLVFTSSVLSAQIVSALLRTKGISSGAVSGNTRRQERRRVIEEFKSGEVKVLVNCDVLLQGFDAPKVTTLYVARPTFSPGRYLQMVGRGLRGPANGGSEECTIVDLEDTVQDFNEQLAYRNFVSYWDGGRP